MKIDSYAETPLGEKPITFSLEIWSHDYAYNPFGKQITVSFDNLVVSDNEDPISTANITPPHPNADNGWYNRDVILSIEAADNLAGVEKIEYRLNNGPWIVYDFPITVSHEGEHTIEYRSIDFAGNLEKSKMNYFKIDKTAPLIDITLNKYILWNPNHKLVPIHAEVEYTDAISGISKINLISITSNQSENGKGDGNASGDIQEVQLDTFDTEFLLRAERNGGSDQRAYTIIYRAEDFAGNITDKEVVVTVPKSKR
jgi:hypothetical protein